MKRKQNNPVTVCCAAMKAVYLFKSALILSLLLNQFPSEMSENVNPLPILIPSNTLNMQSTVKGGA